MALIEKLIKRLFLNKIVTHRIVDLMNEISNEKLRNIIYVGIEKENNSRQFTYFTIDELIVFYQYTNCTQRSIYELITPEHQVKAYVDFEYYINNNLDIKNQYVGPNCLLKMLHYSLNFQQSDIKEKNNHVDYILQQFLVLEASTSEKISYHFIHANPTVLFENNVTLGLFIKVLIHFSLWLITQHKCASFNINLTLQKYTISDLMTELKSYVNILRTDCIGCQLYNNYVTVAEFAHLLVLNKQNELTLAIDLNVYLKNQQFRMFDCVKIGKNNPLHQSTYFPYDKNSEVSYIDILRKSLLTYIELIDVPVISFQNNQFIHSVIDKLNSSFTVNDNLIKLNKLNVHINTIFSFGTNNLSICNTNKINISSETEGQIKIDSTHPQIEQFTLFIKRIIESDKIHQGYIRSCIRGNRNTDVLFFNIEGEYRYCPRKGAHHQRNTVAILIDSKNLTYTIRCKDSNCNDKPLIWRNIE